MPERKKEGNKEEGKEGGRDQTTILVAPRKNTRLGVK
jgi:hypothetical protein